MRLLMSPDVALPLRRESQLASCPRGRAMTHEGLWGRERWQEEDSHGPAAYRRDTPRARPVQDQYHHRNCNIYPYARRLSYTL